MNFVPTFNAMFPSILPTAQGPMQQAGDLYTSGGPRIGLPSPASPNVGIASLMGSRANLPIEDMEYDNSGINASASGRLLFQNRPVPGDEINMDVSAPPMNLYQLQQPMPMQLQQPVQTAPQQPLQMQQPLQAAPQQTTNTTTFMPEVSSGEGGSTIF